MYDEAVALAKIVDEQKKKAEASANDLAKNASKDIQNLYGSRDQAGDDRDNALRMQEAAVNDGNNVEFERQEQAIQKAEQAMDEYNAKIDDAVAAYAKLIAKYDDLDKSIIQVNKDGSKTLDTSKTKAMEEAVKKVTEEYKNQITQRKKLDVLQSDLTS